MLNKISAGRAIHVTARADISGGELVVMAGMVAVASTDIRKGELGACEVEGVFELPKGAGAIEQGAPVYLGADNKVTAMSGDTFLGVAWADAGAQAATVDVKINFGAAPTVTAASGVE